MVFGALIVVTSDEAEVDQVKRDVLEGVLTGSLLWEFAFVANHDIVWLKVIEYNTLWVYALEKVDEGCAQMEDSLVRELVSDHTEVVIEVAAKACHYNVW